MTNVPPAAPVIDTTHKVEREQVRQVTGDLVNCFDGLPFALAFAFAMSGMFPAIGNTDPMWSAAWAVLPFTWALSAYALLIFFRMRENDYSPAFWTKVRMALAAAHATIWGLFVWVFWEHGNATNQAILSTVTLAIIVSAFFALAAHRRVLLVALGVHWMFGWTAFIHYDGAIAQTFAVAFPLFMVVMLNYGRIASGKYADALRLRFENEALAAQLMQANNAKSAFLSSMSHELRTPLNAIIGYADLMRQGVYGPVSPVRYGEYIENIGESGQHLLKMINDLLDLAKIEAGRRELSAVPVALGEVARDAVRFVEPQAEKAHVSIMLDAKHQLIVRADERAVKQMIINLLSNAVKFSAPGALAVVFCDLMPNGRIAFGVKDTGTGMTPEMQRKALEPYTQAGGDKLTVEGYGTGLGLPIVKGLIEAHQGMLRIESTPGIGSKIWVEFPAERLLRKAEAA